jgi:predicted restriction endonuclease
MKIKSKKCIYRQKDIIWKKAVKVRDLYRCQICGVQYKEGDKGLHSHHIIPRQFENYRWDVDNGLSLCFRCHKVGKFSPHQNAIWFSQWLKSSKPWQYGYLIDKI